MPAQQNRLLQMWDKATKEEREKIAAECNTTASYLYQLTSPKTRRRLNIVTAVAIDKATRRRSKRTKGRIPHVTVFDLAAMYR